MLNKAQSVLIEAPRKPYKDANRLRIALVGLPNSGKTTLFNAVASTYVHSGELTETHLAYGECRVQIGMDEVSLVDFPGMLTLHHLKHDELIGLKYLLWGNQTPAVCAREKSQPPAPFPAPDIIIQVMDATALSRHLELYLELSQLGKPIVVALNMMDQARKKGVHINIKRLQKFLGAPVVPTSAIMGHGIAELFKTSIKYGRRKACPLAAPPSQHIRELLTPLTREVNKEEIHQSFDISHEFLLMQLAAGDRYFVDKLKQHFPDEADRFQQLKENTERQLPRPLEEELHADRHHRAASISETVLRLTSPHEGNDWRYWLDE